MFILYTYSYKKIDAFKEVHSYIYTHIYISTYIIQSIYLRLHERAEEGESDLNADEE